MSNAMEAAAIGAVVLVALGCLVWLAVVFDTAMPGDLPGGGE